MPKLFLYFEQFIKQKSYTNLYIFNDFLLLNLSILYKRGRKEGFLRLTMLNSQQMNAVQTIIGNLLILAGAGTGKTTVLVNRIAEMLKQGILPENILAITFTNKASKELRERIEYEVGEEKAAKIWASTFHSMCIRILKANSRRLGKKLKPGFTVYDSDDSLGVIKKILKDMYIDKDEANPKAIQSAISALKNEMVDVESYISNTPVNEYVDWERAQKVIQQNVFPEEEEVFRKVFMEYQRRLIDYKAVDFDDIILYTVELLMKEEKVLSFYRRKFKYIMIDEYQDTNRAQYVLIKLLAGEVSNVAVVGDDSQAIYSFRGSDYRNILNFNKDYPNAKVIMLEENYRCTDIILQAANEVISHNKNQFKKNLYTSKTGGEKITSEMLENEYQEAEYVTKEIGKRVHSGKQYEDITVLTRTNSQTRTFEQEFIKRGIPYKLIGGVGFFKRKEIKDIVAYINFVINPDDAVNFERIVNFPKRGIGPKTVTSLIQKGRMMGGLSEVFKNLESIKLTTKANLSLKAFHAAIESFRSRLQKDSGDILLRKMVKELGIIEAIMDAKEEEAKKRDRKANVSQLINMAADMVFRGEGETLEDFLEIVSLYSDSDETTDDNSVKIMTIHAAKGLEFPIVFIPGMEEGIFPHERSLAEGSAAIEEERRLFYVALTRAKEKVYLTNAEARRVFGNDTFNEHSRFLTEFSVSLLS